MSRFHFAIYMAAEDAAFFDDIFAANIRRFADTRRWRRRRLRFGCAAASRRPLPIR